MYVKVSYGERALSRDTANKYDTGRVLGKSKTKIDSGFITVLTRTVLIHLSTFVWWPYCTRTGITNYYWCLLVVLVAV